MAVICPTITAGSSHSFRVQMERVAHFSRRLHLDVMDKTFTPHQSVALAQVWWPVGVQADLHIMYKNPGDYIDTIINLKPESVIIHAEADGDFHAFHARMKTAGIKIGLALLNQTAVSEIEPVLGLVDHVLIFSGDLGSFGGRADLELLDKVKQLKSKKPNIEIGWDGGINQHNVQQLAAGGVDVLNVGGFIQRSEHPDKAYATLEALVGKSADE
ncbi:MAG: ribulose-phosphate 3-epimerase [Candidatus Saccharimonadales bacterium]